MSTDRDDALVHPEDDLRRQLEDCLDAQTQAEEELAMVLLFAFAVACAMALLPLLLAGV